MGGLGSGYSQWAFARSVVEHFRVVDVNKVHRKIKLRRGASLNLKGSDEWIELEWTPCNFGGRDPGSFVRDCIAEGLWRNFMSVETNCAAAIASTLPMLHSTRTLFPG